jgi:hypothetical protein
MNLRDVLIAEEQESNKEEVTAVDSAAAVETEAAAGIEVSAAETDGKKSRECLTAFSFYYFKNKKEVYSTSFMSF